MLTSTVARITSRLSRASILTVLACSALGLGIITSEASALTQRQKADAFWACVSGGGSHRDCCHLVGGTYELDHDENGNVVAEHCWVNADRTGPTQGLGLPSSNPVGANPGTGTGASSGAPTRTALDAMSTGLSGTARPPATIGG